MTTPSKIWMRSLSPSLIFVCTRTVSPTRKAGSCARVSGFTLRCSTSSIAFARILPAPSREAAACPAAPSFFRPPTRLRKSSLRQAPDRPRRAVSRPLSIAKAGRRDRGAGRAYGRAPAACARARCARGERVPRAPARDARVVAGEENAGNTLATEQRRPGVLGAFENWFGGERFAAVPLFVPEDAGNEPRDGVDDGEGGELTAGEHEVADRELLVDVVAHPLVDALVAAAHEDELAPLRQLLRLGLVEPRSLRAEQDGDGARGPGAGGLDRRDQRLGFHHHPRSAAVGNVVGHPVLAFREVADVHHARLEEALLARLPEDALPERRLDHAREEREDRDAQTSSLQIEKTLRGIDRDLPRLLVDAHDEGKRHERLLFPVADPQQLLGSRALDRDDVTPLRSRLIHRRHPDQIGRVELVVAGNRQLGAVDQRLLPAQRRGGIAILDAEERDQIPEVHPLRPPDFEPARLAFGGLQPQRSDRDQILRLVVVRHEQDSPADAVRSRDAADGKEHRRYFWAAGACFRVPLMSLATVGEGCAPIFNQCSTRSIFRLTFAGVGPGS